MHSITKGDKRFSKTISSDPRQRVPLQGQRKKVQGQREKTKCIFENLLSDG